MTSIFIFKIIRGQFGGCLYGEYKQIKSKTLLIYALYNHKMWSLLYSYCSYMCVVHEQATSVVFMILFYFLAHFITWL